MRRDADLPRRALVELDGVGKDYGTVVAASDVDLTIDEGEFFTLLGPSGSGKSTVLSLIAGLIAPTSGRIRLGGADMAGRRPYERDIGMVFQSLALFPHMDVFSNVAFPLRMRRVARPEIRELVADALEVVRLPDVQNRHVNELSGGQRQRVALARALVYKPRLLLLDEPLGSLDKRLREDMQLELLRIHRDLSVTIVNVTHDQREALVLSDRIGIVRDGELIQVGAPDELYTSPATPFVASFLGNATLIRGALSRNGESWELVTAALRLRTLPPPGRAPERAALVLRGEDVRLHRESPEVGVSENRLLGNVELVAFEGPTIYYLVVSVDDPAVRINVTEPRSASEPLAVGERCAVTWRVDDAPVLPSDD